MRPVITVEHLRKVYRVGDEKVVALNDIELEIGKGEMCCIVGASGSGKSTLLNQLAGLEKPTRGRVLIGRHEISAMTEDELALFRQQHLGFIFQSYNLLPSLTAAENVALPLMFKGVPKKQREKACRYFCRRAHRQPGLCHHAAGAAHDAGHDEGKRHHLCDGDA